MVSKEAHTGNVEELIWFEQSTLIFVDLAKVFVKLLELFLSDYKDQQKLTYSSSFWAALGLL
jgi:hypothetical protein